MSSQRRIGVKRRRQKPSASVFVVGVVLAALLVAAPPAVASTPAPEFVVPGHALPVAFSVEGGAVIAQLAGFETIVRCSGSHGEGQITGPHSTVSSYRFTGCETEGGSDGGRECKSVGAEPNEIVVGPIEGDLVYTDLPHAKVAILLNPKGGVYISFQCGGEFVEGSGAFLSQVGPVDTETSSFTATLTQTNGSQTPDQYEGESGLVKVLPIGKRGSHEAVPTAVEMATTVHTEDPVLIATAPVKAPAVESVSVSHLTENDATLEATLDTEGLATSYEFQLWSSPCSHHGSGCEVITSIPLPGGMLLGSFVPQQVSLDLNSAGVTLTGGEYGVSVKATNALGSATKSGGTFEPPEPPPSPLTTTPATAQGQQTPPVGGQKPPASGTAPKGTPRTSSPHKLSAVQILRRTIKACDRKPRRQRAGCIRRAHRQYATAVKSRADHR